MRLSLTSRLRYPRGVATFDPETASPPNLQAFRTTHWSVVLKAGRADTPAAEAALASLCEASWYPLYLYVRRRGYGIEDAQDLTQAFLARLLERNWIADARREKGRFRSFLLAAMNHFLANEWDKAHAWKRGGKALIVPLQFETAEHRYSHEPVDTTTPEDNFEVRWALALLERVLDRLKAEHAQEGRERQFQLLHPTLVGDRTAQPYAALAVSLGVTEGAVKAAVHRLRIRYRELLREEIAQTVSTAAEIDDELRHLLSVLSRA